MPLSTIIVEKERAEAYQPLLLATFTFTDGTVLRLSTHPLNTAEGGYQYGGADYLSRLEAQNINAIQALSDQGLDIIPAVTLRVADPDAYLYTNYEASHGFAGAALSLVLVIWEADTANFSSDSARRFDGICDPISEYRDTGFEITAKSRLSMNKATLPVMRAQSECLNIFPITKANRIEGCLESAEDSQYWSCGYSPDVVDGDIAGGTAAARGNLTGGVAYTDCGFTKAECVARGMYKQDSAARVTGRFSGSQWQPADSFGGREYVSGQNVSGRNTAPSTEESFYPLVYGTQWVRANVRNVVGDPNSTRMEAVICSGKIQGILRVVVNNETVPCATDVDGTTYTVENRLFRWNIINRGTRSGAPNTDAMYDGLGDPYGSLATIQIVVPRRVSDANSTPTVLVLVKGPQVRIPSSEDPAYVATWPYAYTENPVWHLLDVLTWSNWKYTQIDIVAWCQAAATCGQAGNVSTNGTAVTWIDGAYFHPGLVGRAVSIGGSSYTVAAVGSATGLTLGSSAGVQTGVGMFVGYVTYLDSAGNSLTQPRYKSSFAIEHRKTAAEVVLAIRRSMNAVLVPNSSTGLLQLFIRQTLADQQPAAISGSNYATPISSKTAAGVVTNGYAAYKFDESSIIEGSFRISHQPITELPNRVSVSFQDADNQYQVDQFSKIDNEAVSRLGAQEVNRALDVLGITTFDEARRLTKAYQDEKLRGNPRGDAAGSMSFEIETTMKAAHLRTEQICVLSWQKLAISNQLVRVVRLSPSTNFARCRIALAWHNDNWYLNSNGQLAAPEITNPNRARLSRRPYPWKPYSEQPIANDAIFNRQAWNFTVTPRYSVAKDGSGIARLEIIGHPPVNNLSQGSGQAFPPRGATTGTTASTGGTIAGGQRVFMAVVGTVGSGATLKLSGMSKLFEVTIPSGTATNTAVTPTLYWPSGTTGYLAFIGGSEATLSFFTGATASTPSTITFTAIYPATYGPPDPMFDHLVFQTKRVLHAGVFGLVVASVGAGTITLSPASAWSVNQWAGADVMLLGRSSGSLSIANYRVTSNTGTVLTVTPDPAGTVIAGDVVVMATKPSTFTASTIGDANFINSGGSGLTVNEETGRAVRIFAGTGVGQVRTIISNTTTVLTIDGAFNPVPDATSRFIVEEQEWHETATGPLSATLPDSPAAQIVGSFDVSNLNGEVLLVRMLTADEDGNTALEEFSPMRMVYVFGSLGSPAADEPWATLTVDGGTNSATPDLALGLNMLVTLDRASTLMNAPIYTGGVLVSGKRFKLKILKDATASRTVTWSAAYAGLGSREVGPDANTWNIFDFVLRPDLVTWDLATEPLLGAS